MTFYRIIDVGTEAKEINKPRAGIIIISSALVGPIAHIGGHATVAHQGGDGIDLLRGAGGGEDGGHVGVVVRGTVVVDRKGAVVGLVAVGTSAVDGVAPVVDDLGHGGGNTAGRYMTVVRTGGVLGTEDVVVLALAPGGGEEGTDGIG